MTSIKEIIAKTRTYRRFHQDTHIEHNTLKDLIDLARMAGSAMNLQPLKYMLINDPAQNEKVFPHLGWAGYLTDWPGPIEGERPAAYIICLLDTGIYKQGDFDMGIASQNILIGATEQGLGGCRIASISPGLTKELALPDHLGIMLVIALGVPKEEVKIIEVEADGSIKYWRDQEERHHVPKRRLEDILVPPPFNNE